jgi:hypothetical protein
VSRRRKLTQLAWREYLPLAATAAMWAVIVLAIGHADAARLLAAVVFTRGALLLTKCATPTALKRRAEAPREIRRQARRFAFNVQGTALVIALLLLVLLAEAFKAVDQRQIAAFLPYIALGLPARYLRLADVRTASPYFRLALATGGLVMASIGWLASFSVTAMALVFGVREWIAYAALRWWPRTTRPARVKLDGPLHFAEVAGNSAIYGRRMLTYRMTKSLLTVLGPFGNAAARTGRGLNWHKKIEPYVPHHLGGFILFSLATLGGAAILVVRSGEPAAMVLAAGLAQIGGAAANVLIFWRWLPPPGTGATLEDDDDDE